MITYQLPPLKLVISDKTMNQLVYSNVFYPAKMCNSLEYFYSFCETLVCNKKWRKHFTEIWWIKHESMRKFLDSGWFFAWHLSAKMWRFISEIMVGVMLAKVNAVNEAFWAPLTKGSFVNMKRHYGNDSSLLQTWLTNRFCHHVDKFR